MLSGHSESRFHARTHPVTVFQMACIIPVPSGFASIGDISYTCRSDGEPCNRYTPSAELQEARLNIWDITSEFLRNRSLGTAGAISCSPRFPIQWGPRVQLFIHRATLASSLYEPYDRSCPGRTHPGDYGGQPLLLYPPTSRSRMASLLALSRARYPDARPHTIFTSLVEDMITTVFDHTEVDSLVRLRSSSRVADLYVGTYLSRKLEAHLGRFVSNVGHFLHELEITCSVISGSTALAVLFRHAWTPNDLDVYAPCDLFWHLVAYLVNVEGYSASFVTTPGYTTSDKIRKVGRLSRADGQTIDVIQSASNSPLLPLSCFWNTALMNYITPTSFCVSYPHLTDAQHALIFERGPVPSAGRGGVPFPRASDELIRKYEARGFELHIDPMSWARTAEPKTKCAGIDSACCPLAMRHFGDRHCVTGSLYPIGGRRSTQLRVDLLKAYTVVWWRGGKTCGDSCAAAGDWVTGDSYSCSRLLLAE